MKKIYILRHAKSDYPEGVDDRERPLNKRGQKACQAIGLYIKQNNIIPDQIISSDAKRTSQTINTILQSAGLDIDVHFTKNLYLATPGEMLKEISKIDNEAESVMVVCHNPGAEQLAKILAHSGKSDAIERLKEKYPTAGLAYLSVNTDDWAEIQPASGYLEAFVIPKMLA